MKNSHAYDLVHSLNMAEKRMFRVYASRHVLGDQNKYLVLYDALLGLPEYDEKVLAARIKPSGYDTRYLKADQNYLYNLVLKSLLLMHSGKSANLQVKELLMVIEILYDRGAYAECRKEIQKALGLARRYELHDLWMNLLFWERKLSLFYTAAMRTEEDIVSEMETVQIALAAYVQYTATYARAMQLLRRAMKTRSASVQKEYRILLQQPHIKRIKTGLPLICRIRYHQVHAGWFFIEADRTQELKHNRSLLQLVEQHSFYLEEYPLDYVNTYSRILSIVKDIDPGKFPAELEKFKSFRPPSHHIAHQRISAHIFHYGYTLQIAALLDARQFSAAWEILPEIRTGLKTCYELLNPQAQITWQYIQAYLLFIAGEHKASLRQVNRILNDFEEDMRPEIYNFTRMLNILLHAELKNFHLIRSLQRSAAYYFAKQKDQYRIENAVLRFFADARNYKHNPVEKWAQLKEELEQIRKDFPLEKSAFRYLDFDFWIAHKLRRPVHAPRWFA